MPKYIGRVINPRQPVNKQPVVKSKDELLFVDNDEAIKIYLAPKNSDTVTIEGDLVVKPAKEMSKKKKKVEEVEDVKKEEPITEEAPVLDE